jgi:hypothetical protein
MKRPEKYAQPPILYTAGQSFPDGSIVDLVRDTDGLARLVLYHPNASEVDYPASVTYNEVAYRPLDEPEAWIRAVQLPQEAVVGTDLNEIFLELCALFAPFGKTESVLLSAFVIATWWVDRVQYAPLLCVSGEGADSVLKALQFVCRRGTLLTAVNSCGTFPCDLRPTLLVRATSQKLALKFLKEQPTNLLPTWRGGNLIDAYAARAIGINNSACMIPGVLNLVIDIELQTTTYDSNRIQAMLLGYRLQNWGVLQPSREELEDPLLRTIVFAAGNNAELRRRITDAYLENLEDTDAAANLEEERAVTEALASFANADRSKAYVHEIAERATRCMRLAGSSLEQVPRAVGDTLRRLGLNTERIDYHGRGIKFTADVKARIAELALRFGTNTTHSAAQRFDCAN